METDNIKLVYYIWDEINNDFVTDIETKQRVYYQTYIGALTNIEMTQTIIKGEL